MIYWPVSERNWVVYRVKLSERTITILWYQFDPESRKLTEDPKQPLHGKVSQASQWIILQPPYQILLHDPSADRIQKDGFFRTILSWLAKIGIHRGESDTRQYLVADLQTDAPLRQVSGVPVDLELSKDGRYLIGHGHPHNGLVGYIVPHHLWEKSLSWMQWLSWLLVFPWPLRYLVSATVHSIRPPVT
jgi:hypothetical protein